MNLKQLAFTVLSVLTETDNEIVSSLLLFLCELGVRFLTQYDFSPFEQSVTTLVSLSPLPPFISLRSLRSLRLKIFFGGRGLPRAGSSEVIPYTSKAPEGGRHP